MQRGITEAERRFEHGFRQRRMGMRRPGQVVSRCARLHGQSTFRNQVGHMGSHEVNAEHFATPGFAHQCDTIPFVSRYVTFRG